MHKADAHTSGMRDIWNKLSRKSKKGFISFLNKGAEWDAAEFHLTGIRFVDRMAERFGDYGNWELNRSSILEIGCGVGRFAKPLSSRFKHYHGVDISVNMVKEAKKYCACMPNVSFQVNSGTSLEGFADNSIEYCVSAGVFQHITHIDVIIAYIKESMRVLRPGGVLLFQFEGNREEPVGQSITGAKITAGALDGGLGGLPYKIREISADPADPVRNVVIVMQKPEDGEAADPAARSFKDFKMTGRRWLIGVYDDIKTNTSMHDRLRGESRRLTFYD